MLFSLSLLLVSGALTDNIPFHLFEPLGGEVFLSEEEAEEARRRFHEEPWAKAIGDTLVARAEKLATARLRVPAAPGQWMHWYVCDADGARLKAESPTEHVCTVCAATYTGWPYDEVYNTMRHNYWLEGVETLGWAYTLTKEPRYAQRVREILLEYGAFYKTLEFHNVDGQRVVTGGRLYAQTLEEAIALCKIIRGYDRVYRNPCFRKPDHEEIERELLRPMIHTIRRYNPGKTNWQSWHNAAVGSAALLLGDQDLADWAINGRHGFLFQMEECVLANGMWYEETAGYHFYAMRAMVHLMEAAARAGIPIYRHPKTLSMLEAPLRYVLPDLTLPPINDSERLPLTKYRPYYEIGYRRFRHPKFAAICTPRDTVEALFWGMDKLPDPAHDLELQSSNEEAAGLAILRDQSNTTALYFDYGSGKSGHAHPARLGLMLYAQDALRLLDPGMIAYGHPLHKTWYATTLAHNTVVVNQESQSNTGGELLHYSSNERGAQVAARCDGAYPGVRLERWTVLHDQAVLDVFRCFSRREATFDYPLHFAGELTALSESVPADPLGTAAGYDKLTNLRHFVEHLESVELRTGPGTRIAVQVLAGGADGYVAEAFGATPQELSPMILLRQQGTEAVFVIALQLLDDGQDSLPVQWHPSGILEIGNERILLDGWDDVEAAGEREADDQASTGASAVE
jgi:hypothetical protein